MMQELEFENSSGKLCLHRQSLKGAVQDYIISFNGKVSDINMVVGKTFDLFQQLMNQFKDTHRVKARLVAQVNYLRLDEDHETVANDDYHFASYGSEEVLDVDEFYQRHLSKVSSRMDSFHQNGSRLMINHIRHIHIQLAMIKRK